MPKVGSHALAPAGLKPTMYGGGCLPVQSVCVWLRIKQSLLRIRQSFFVYVSNLGWLCCIHLISAAVQIAYSQLIAELSSAAVTCSKSAGPSDISAQEQPLLLGSNKVSHATTLHLASPFVLSRNFIAPHASILTHTNSY